MAKKKPIRPADNDMFKALLWAQRLVEGTPGVYLSKKQKESYGLTFELLAYALFPKKMAAFVANNDIHAGEEE